MLVVERDYNLNVFLLRGARKTDPEQDCTGENWLYGNTDHGKGNHDLDLEST